jgi:hypothetical protein
LFIHIHHIGLVRMKVKLMYENGKMRPVKTLPGMVAGG